MAIPGISGRKTEAQGVCEAARLREPRDYQLTSLSSMVSPSWGL